MEDETKKLEIVEKPENGEVKEEEEETDPDYICGVALRLLPNGQGLNILALEGKEFVRTGTLTDLIAMAAVFSNHLSSITTASKSMEVLADAGLFKMKRKGIIH